MSASPGACALEHYSSVHVRAAHAAMLSDNFGDRSFSLTPIARIADLSDIVGPCVFVNATRSFLERMTPVSVGSYWDTVDSDRRPVAKAVLMRSGSSRRTLDIRHDILYSLRYSFIYSVSSPCRPFIHYRYLYYRRMNLSLYRLLYRQNAKRRGLAGIKRRPAYKLFHVKFPE